ncbi:MAG: multicopper oxidase domain-containing protein, partial [Beijerinckiaceae bacterium]
MTGFAIPTRRCLLIGAATLAIPLAGRPTGVWSQQITAAPTGVPQPIQLNAAPADLQLRAEPRPKTTALIYGGQSPGPLLRARKGEDLAIRLTNSLDQPTSLHFRGMRVPAALDGVGGFSGPAIAPGATADIRLPLRDAGFYLYHPLIPGSTAAQLDAGLY